MILKVIVLVTIAEVCFAQLTYKDGKVGVNFAGYSAEAGLGEILTGNSEHGGLTASAGTPFGQRAGAGLEKNGAAYADASAGHGIDAGAAVGAPKLNANINAQKVETIAIAEKAGIESAPTPHTVYVQKVRPRKFYRLNKVVRNADQVKAVNVQIPEVQKIPDAAIYGNSDTVITGTKTYEQSGTFFDNIFNIPISVLKSVNTLLNNRGQPGSFGVTKTKSYEYA